MKSKTGVNEIIIKRNDGKIERMILIPYSNDPKLELRGSGRGIFFSCSEEGDWVSSVFEDEK